MCGPDSPSDSVRSSQDGGAVAVIHHASSPQQLRLFFHNPTSPLSAPTHVSCEAEHPEWCGQVMRGLVQLQIHQHGDLTASNQAMMDPTSTLHVLQLKRTPRGKNESELEGRLDLGVGGSGVIGRMLSVMGGGGEIGNGVIGWN